jgi:bifunctional NMN adenylyltransferase/nudix hydrolase
MDVKTAYAELGVIIGRFQVNALHEGHRALIDSVRSKHKKVLILLGSTPGVLVTRNNPLDYFTRAMMMREAYPDVIVMPIHDMPSDTDWSKSVDSRIEEVLGVGSAILYGSRDAFIPHYSGRYQTIELDTSRNVSGTELRKAISDEVRSSPDFRHGVIYAAHNRHPAIYPTVDVAIVKRDSARKATHIVLGHKKNDPWGLWRFPGGFVDPTKDRNLDLAAAREACEEIGCGISTPQYIGSMIVDDWRYRKEIDKIMTTVFICDYLYGIVEGKDDLAEAKLFSLDNFDSTVLVPQHKAIMQMVLSHLEKE